MKLEKMYNADSTNSIIQKYVDITSTTPLIPGYIFAKSSNVSIFRKNFNSANIPGNVTNMNPVIRLEKRNTPSIISLHLCSLYVVHVKLIISLGLCEACSLGKVVKQLSAVLPFLNKLFYFSSHLWLVRNICHVKPLIFRRKYLNRRLSSSYVLTYDGRQQILVVQRIFYGFLKLGTT